MFNKIIRVKIKKTVILNRKKGIISFIKSYFEARIRKKKTFNGNYIFIDTDSNKRHSIVFYLKKKNVA